MKNRNLTPAYCAPSTYYILVLS